jgi:uncharacterized protein YbjT (DUF2867 family)/ligand-binding SRPBCC domain-containing protein
MSAQVVLIAGATGSIGGRLLRSFEEGGRSVRCLARDPDKVAAMRATTEVVQGDCLDEQSLDRALAGVGCAYYLVHSMAAGARFAELDRRAAENFGRAAARAGVRRIIYLGGLADDVRSLSAHLQSRAETGAILRASGVPVIEFRASIVIGAGSLSFEIIRALVERLPIMICPRWVETRTQPIAIDDVVAYLAAALDLSGDHTRVFEIGGPEVLSYGEMMRLYARLRGLRRVLLPVPLLTPRLSGLWLALVTPAQARIGRALVEGLRNATVVRSPQALETFAVNPVSLEVAFTRAIDDRSAAHWKTDTRSLVVDAPPSETFAPIRRIGGATGWYYGTLLWKMRGRVDDWLGGVGMARGRRDVESCGVGDAIDGWTVEAYEPDRRLRLAADLKMPGRGWLEFVITPLDRGKRSRISLTATFDPKGLLGRAYWFALLPIHDLMFRNLLQRIARHALGQPSSALEVFAHRSIVPGAAAEVFRWHERPEAPLELMPSRRWVRIASRTGSVHDDDRITFSIGLGPLRLLWEARHYGYIRGRQFCDEQIRGPFRTWRHTHRVEAIGPSQTLYEDRIEYALPLGALRGVVDSLVRRLLERTFVRRHQIVRAYFQGQRSVGSPRTVRNVIE